MHTPGVVCRGISITSEHLQEPQLTVEKESNLQCSSRLRETAVKFVAIVRRLVRESPLFISPALQELETCLFFKLPEMCVFECLEMLKKVVVGMGIERAHNVCYSIPCGWQYEVLLLL